MSSAMQLIVSGYVKVKDLQALTELFEHRRKMLNDLNAVTGIDPANAISAVQDEITIIEAGLKEMKPPSGFLPDDGRN